MYVVDSGYYVAGIDFETKEAAPILRRFIKSSRDEFLKYVTKKGYKIVAIVKGAVEKVYEKETKFGPMFSALVDGTWYTLGKTANGLSNGDYVEFIAEQNARGFWDVQKGSLKPVDKPAKATAPLKGTEAPKASYNDARQTSIIYQSSRNVATELVCMMVEQGMIDFGKAKYADKQAIVEAYLDKYTMHFFEEGKKESAFASQSTEDKSGDPVTKGLEDDDIGF